MSKARTLCLVVLGVLLLVAPAEAHFPWLVADQEGNVSYFFGENPADRTYHLPASIAKAEVHLIQASGQARKVELKAVETDDFVGLTSAKAVGPNPTLVSPVTYGIHRGSLLNYYSLHQGGKLPTSLDAYQGRKQPLALHARLVDTDSGVDVHVLWKGKPLADAEVHLYCDDGHEEGKAKTGKDGKVSFTDAEVEDGLNGIMVGFRDKDAKGERNGERYEAVSHYLTVTFFDPQ